MRKGYYALGAALPVLKQSDLSAAGQSSTRFLKELQSVTSKSDQKQLDLLLLREDNRLLMQLLKAEDETAYEMVTPTLPPEHYALGIDQLRHLIDTIKAGKTVAKKEYPKYMVDFVEDYLHPEVSEEGEEEHSKRRDLHFPEDLLAEAYYKYVQKKGDAFLRAWSSMEQSIALVFAAVLAQNFNLDSEKYVVGSGELIEILRSGDWRKVSYLKEADTVKEILKLTEEKHLALRERSIDELKWRLIDTLTFTDVFSIDAMMAYLLKLLMLERWSVLDNDKGEARFREIITSLNEEGQGEIENYRAYARQVGAINRRS